MLAKRFLERSDLEVWICPSDQHGAAARRLRLRSAAARLHPRAVTLEQVARSGPRHDERRGVWRRQRLSSCVDFLGPGPSWSGAAKAPGCAGARRGTTKPGTRAACTPCPTRPPASASGPSSTAARQSSGPPRTPQSRCANAMPSPLRPRTKCVVPRPARRPWPPRPSTANVLPWRAEYARLVARAAEPARLPKPGARRTRRRRANALPGARCGRSACPPDCARHPPSALRRHTSP